MRASEAPTATVPLSHTVTAAARRTKTRGKDGRVPLTLCTDSLILADKPLADLFLFLFLVLESGSCNLTFCHEMAFAVGTFFLAKVGSSHIRYATKTFSKIGFIHISRNTALQGDDRLPLWCHKTTKGPRTRSGLGRTFYLAAEICNASALCVSSVCDLLGLECQIDVDLDRGADDCSHSDSPATRDGSLFRRALNVLDISARSLYLHTKALCGKRLTGLSVFLRAMI